MYVDPSGNFSLVETQVAAAVKSTIVSTISPVGTIQKLMSWANLAVTIYDVTQQAKLLFSGEASIAGLVGAIARGIIKQPDTVRDCEADSATVSASDG